MVRISCMDRVTNEELFNKANTVPTLPDRLLYATDFLIRKAAITFDLMMRRTHGTLYSDEDQELCVAEGPR